MKTITGARRHGGVSRSIDYLRSSLITPDPNDEAAKPGAIVRLSQLISVAIEQTASGDPDCGYFVAELLAFLCKKQDSLSERNETFRQCFSRWESSRVATRRGSPLRPLIHSILAQAHRERDIQGIAKHIPNSALVIKRN